MIREDKQDAIDELDSTKVAEQQRSGQVEDSGEGLSKEQQKEERDKEKARLKAEKIKNVKAGFFKARDYNVLEPFMTLFRPHRSIGKKVLFKRTLQEIGLVYDVSLLEDIDTEYNKGIRENTLAEFSLYTFVSLFCDHLFSKRIDKSFLTAKDNAPFFQKYDTANHYFTKQQYRVSLYYFYKIKGEYSTHDPLLKISKPSQSKKDNVLNKFDMLRTIKTRRASIIGLVHRIQDNEMKAQSKNEKEFIMIYNRCVDLVDETLGEHLDESYKIKCDS